MIGGHGNFQVPGNFQGPELLAGPGFFQGAWKFSGPGNFQAPWKIPGGSLSPVRHAVRGHLEGVKKCAVIEDATMNDNCRKL